ncbi:MAG: hypothetical protein EPO24_13210, partial [Bacteroidetes bacterium]
GELNTDGSDNSFFGQATGSKNSTGYDNSFFGRVAGFNNTTGSGNSFFGRASGLSNTTGYSNIAIGKNALYMNTVGHNLVAIGDSALYNQGEDVLERFGNTAVGSKAGFSNTTGYENSFFGTMAGYLNNTGQSNSFFGYASGYNHSSNPQNSFFGAYSGFSNEYGALNSFFGALAGYSNVSGNQNSFFGKSSGTRNYSGLNNSFFGTFGGYNNINGSSNSCFGISAGSNNLSGDNNTHIGAGTGPADTLTDFDNATTLGYGTTTTASNQVRIGNTSVTSIAGQVGFSTYSDARFKSNISEKVKGLEFILKLRPVTYRYDVEKENAYLGKHEESSWNGKYEVENILFSGFLAQEVEEAAKSAGYEFSGIDAPKNKKDFYSLRYAEFVVPLVKAVQEQQQLIEALRAQHATMQLTIDTLAEENMELKTIRANLKAIQAMLNINPDAQSFSSVVDKPLK